MESNSTVRDYEVDEIHQKLNKKLYVKALIQQKLCELSLKTESGEITMKLMDGLMQGIQVAKRSPISSKLDSPTTTHPNTVAANVCELKKLVEEGLEGLNSDMRKIFGNSELVLHTLQENKPSLTTGMGTTVGDAIMTCVSGMILVLLLDAAAIGAEKVLSICERLLGAASITQGKHRPLLVKKVLDTEGFNHQTILQNCVSILKETMTYESGVSFESPFSTLRVASMMKDIAKVLEVPMSVCVWSKRGNSTGLDSIHHEHKLLPSNEHRLVLMVESHTSRGRVLFGFLPLKLRLAAAVGGMTTLSKKDDINEVRKIAAAKHDFTFNAGTPMDAEIDQFLQTYDTIPIQTTIAVFPESSFRYILKRDYFVYTFKAQPRSPWNTQTLRSWKLLQFDVIKRLNSFLDQMSESTQMIEIQSELAESRKKLLSKNLLSADRPTSTTIIQNPVYIQHSIVQHGGGIFPMSNYPAGTF